MQSPSRRTSDYKAYAELRTKSEYSDYEQERGIASSSSSSMVDLNEINEEICDKQSEYHDDVNLDVVDPDSTLDRISVNDDDGDNSTSKIGVAGSGLKSKINNADEFEFSYNPILKS